MYMVALPGFPPCPAGILGTLYHNRRKNAGGFFTHVFMFLSVLATALAHKGVVTLCLQKLYGLFFRQI